MNSKNILILGIVFIFLLNVIAVHNYIDNYYKNKNVDQIANIQEFFNKIKDKFIKKEEKEQEKIVLQESNTPISKEDFEDLVEYKSNYFNQKVAQKLKEEKKQVNKTEKTSQEKPKEENKTKVITINKANKAEKKPVKEEQKTKKIAQKDDIQNKTQKPKRREDASLDSSKENAYLKITFNVNEEYAPKKIYLKKMAKKLDDNKIIKIKMYKFSKKVKKLLDTIKTDLVDQGIDVDDIEVLYKKDESKKDIIKVLLTKKD